MKVIKKKMVFMMPNTQEAFSMAQVLLTLTARPEYDTPTAPKGPNCASL